MGEEGHRPSIYMSRHETVEESRRHEVLVRWVSSLGEDSRIIPSRRRGSVEDVGSKAEDMLI